MGFKQAGGDRRMTSSEPEVTLKNTKAEILEALNRALKRAEAAEKGKLNPEKEEKERGNKRAVESAKKAVEQSVFSKELNDKFNDLQVALAVEEDRLQELYGVGREVQKLALVIEAGRERIAEIDAERLEKETALTSSLEKLDAEYAQRKAALQKDHDAVSEKLKIDRTREKEEYTYNLDRTRERENNAWADKKAVRETELQKREALASELLADAENKTEHIRSLEEKVDNIPALVATEKESAIATTTEALKHEYAHQSALAEMERNGIVARLEDKIDFLQKELDNSIKAVGALQGKLDKAYAEIRDLATTTVESTGGLKIIGTQEKSGG